MAKKLKYEVIKDWEQLPIGFVHRDVCGVAVDSMDKVYLITRGDSRVIVYEQNGTFVTTWGEDIFTSRTHGIAIAPDNSVYTVDDGDHTVRKFTPDGKQLLVIGTPGKPSDTGYYIGKESTTDRNEEEPSKRRQSGLGTFALYGGTIKRGGGPFNRPTGVSVASNGDIYISDGYGNARIHHFTPEGKLVRSWGEPGSGPGQFNLPHGVCVTQDGRVLVADRENDRVQIFSLEGEYIEQWTHLQRPTDICVDREGFIYVSNLWWRVGQRSFVNGVIRFDLPGHISILDSQGNLMLRWISADRCALGNFVAPHTVCVDSRGDIYVGEVTYTFGVRNGLVPSDCHMFQKLSLRTG